jgi:hypothetical protein
MSQINRVLRGTMIGVAPPFHLPDEQPFELRRSAVRVAPTPVYIPPARRKQLPTMRITDFPPRRSNATVQMVAGWVVCVVTTLILWAVSP